MLSVDFDALKQELSDCIVEGPQERYQFTWPEKSKHKRLANTPTTNTLRPCREESVDFDNTKNLYIEGDNLEVLKILRETYLGKVKMIYIDPPYNTGNDFVYNDNYIISKEAFSAIDGCNDINNNRLLLNTTSNGRFHTDWLNMIYPRLLISKSLLTDDGVLFISIDDNEVSNMVKVCDEIFGEHNRISIICHKSRASVSNDKIISSNHNFILFYAKNSEVLEKKRTMVGLDPIIDGFNYDDGDGKGKYRLTPVDGPGGAKKGNPYYEFLGISGYWRFSKETMEEKYNQNLIVQKENSLYQKYYESVALKSRRTITTWWDDAGLTSSATSKLKTIMGGSSFDTPKPLELIDRMLRLITSDDPDAIVMDFFSGSSTTAHAVMNYNCETNGKRRFIMIQLPESIDEKTDAYSNGYRLITEIGKKRLKIAGNLLLNENPQLDVGFRVFKCDSSNMRDVFYSPSDVLRKTLDDYVDLMKKDRNPEDLLTQVMLELGIELSVHVTKEIIKGHATYNVDKGYLLACFDEQVDEPVVEMMAQNNPESAYAVFRSGPLMTDDMLSNIEQIFKTYSPQTNIRIL